jgi:flagellar basal-body rod protein FlgC
MNISGISLSGIRASTTRLTASASNIANAASDNYEPVHAVQGDLAGGGVTARIEASGAAEVDLTDEMVGMLVSRLAFQANAKMLETAHDLDKGLLEALA